MNQKKNDKNFSTTSNTSSQLSPIEVSNLIIRY